MIKEEARMSRRTPKFSASGLARFAAFDAADEVETLTVSLPEDLSTLSADEITALRASIVEAFNELRAGGDTTDATIDALEALSQMRIAVDADIQSRVSDEAARVARLAALDASMNPAAPEASADSDEDEGDELAGDEDPEDAEEADEDAPADDEAVAEVVAEAEAIVAEATETPELIAASGDVQEPATTFTRGPISVPRLRSRQPVSQEENPVTTPVRSAFRAAVNVPGIVANSELNLDEVSAAFAEMTERASRASAYGTGVKFSDRHQIAQIVKEFDPRAVVGDDNDADSAIAFATSQDKVAAMVAAGGWCAPSETVYDLCQLESRDGLVSVPEIQLNRGGLRFTQGPDWADIFNSTGFCFDETDDIGGLYTTEEVQTLTEGGAGLTSFTVTFGGQTTSAIPDDSSAAVVQAALEALSTIGPNNVFVTKTASGASTAAYRIVFVNALANQNVAQFTTTPTGGSGTVTPATVTQGGGILGPKPCNIVPCPSFTDVRLNVCGVCVQSGNLLNRAYPELVRRYVSGAITAHYHRMSTNVIASMVAQSTAVTPTNATGFAGINNSGTANLLSVIELEAEDIKYKRRMGRGVVLEAIFPFWARGVIRADLSRRQGYSDGNASFAVSDAEIDAWFRQRGINAQFVYNWQNLGASGAALAWPTSLQFLLYPAGTFVKGASPLITIEMLRDSTLNANNNFTAIFTEEAWNVMKLCHESRVITVNPYSSNGWSNLGTAA